MWMNELRMCRHGLVERYSSLPVKTVWSAGCANGPFDICVLSADEGKDVKRRGKVRVSIDAPSCFMCSHNPRSPCWSDAAACLLERKLMRKDGGQFWVCHSIILKRSYRRQLFVMDIQYVETPRDRSSCVASRWMDSDVVAGVAEQSSYEKVPCLKNTRFTTFFSNWNMRTSPF